jgi:hypothetical protein
LPPAFKRLFLAAAQTSTPSGRRVGEHAVGAHLLERPEAPVLERSVRIMPRPAVRPGTFPQLPVLSGFPARLPAVLADLRQRAHGKEYAAHKLWAEEFVMAP